MTEQRRSLKRIIAQSLSAVMLTASWSSLVQAGPPSILNMFQERNTAGSEAQLALKDEHGPWLILAMTLNGDDAEERAIELAKELKQTLRVPVYVHRKEFDHSQPLAQASTRLNNGRQESLYTKRVRHLNASREKVYAVLVGNYASPDDASVTTMLEKIKTAQPKCLVPKAEDMPTKENVQTKDSSWLISTKRMLLWQKSESGAKKGPMGAAFVTRNPLLPDDFFASAVDDFVVKLNENVTPAQQSLLKNPKRYTVRVATFRGRVVTELAGGMGPKRSDEEISEELNKAAMQAHDLASALREKGVEAYEFHDRSASYVCIGGFDTLGEEAPGGGPFVYNPEMVSIMNQYCGYSVRSFKDAKTGYITNTPTCKMLNNIPFDVEGKFISVPRASTSKLYQGSLMGKPRFGE